MNTSIRHRIWGGFGILVVIFIVNTIVTVITINNSRKLSGHISTVIDPSQQYLQDLRAIIIESKMYATNWVFLRGDIEDKTALRQLHTKTYPEVRNRVLSKLQLLNDKKIVDSLAQVLNEFEELIAIEKDVMSRLEKFEDYDDPVKKMISEQIIEDEVIPRTAAMLNSLNGISHAALNVKTSEYKRLERYSIRLTTFIPLLAIFIACLGILMSIYFTRIITQPLKRIEQIIKGLGRGVISKVDQKETADEIGTMTKAVNNLSEKLRETALFASEVGNRNYNAPFTPLSDEDILGRSLITMRDNIKTSEEVLLATNEELKKSNSELDRFVYSVSHDLRAPLSSMLGVVSLMEAETTDKDIIGDIRLLKNSINKLDGFIGDILDYSRNSRMEINALEISFESTLDDIKNNLKHMASANGKVDVRVNIKERVPFYSDKTRVSIILNNLISNAIRYSNPMAAVPFVAIDIDIAETNASIIIEDNGIGIAPENLNRVFDMFYRVSKKSVGSGLGLYIVKETVEKLHGNIQIESEPEKGTKFIITLPNLSNT